MSNRNDDPKQPTVDQAMTEIANATTEQEFVKGMEDLGEALAEQPADAVDNDDDDWGDDDSED